MVITDDPELVNMTSGFRTPMLEVRDAGLRVHTSTAADRVVSGPSGNSLADDVFEEACRMLQASRFPSLFQR
jgi:hypothetical protein